LKEKPPIYQAHHFQVPRTAHYYTLGTPSEAIEDFWLVCHGYGQLGSEIIHKFEKFDDGKHLIVAAEGLSRFYWGGVTGKVSASLFYGRAPYPMTSITDLIKSILIAEN